MQLDTAITWVFVINGILFARVLWHLAPCLRGEFHEEFMRTKIDLARTRLELERVTHDRDDHRGHCDGCDCFSFLDGAPEAEIPPAA